MPIGGHVGWPLPHINLATEYPYHITHENPVPLLVILPNMLHYAT